MHPVQKREALRSLETFAFQTAYYLLQDERKAALAAGAAMTEVYRSERFFRSAPKDRCAMLRRAVMKKSLELACRPESLLHQP